LVDKRSQRLSKVPNAASMAVQVSVGPSGLQRAIECKRILLAEPDDNFRIAPGSHSITPNHLEPGLEHIGVDQGGHMTRFDHVGDGSFDERPRWSDLTEQPLCDGEVDRRDRAYIPAEAEPGLTIPLGIVKAQRLN
jgi:hypothetical protein